MTVVASAAGLASNLAFTVPLVLVVVFGAVAWPAESWLIPTRQSGVVERRPSDRERARRQRQARRRSCPHTEGKKASA